MNTTKSIVWQKWVDPLGNSPDETDWLPEDIEEEQEQEDEDEETYDSTRRGSNQEAHKAHLVPCIKTPMGLMPMGQDIVPSSRIFNFWLAHTNFNITQAISEQIEKVDGVETLDIFTRYRFRIAIGKAFSASIVMQNIQNQLCK